MLSQQIQVQLTSKYYEQNTENSGKAICYSKGETDPMPCSLMQSILTAQKDLFRQVSSLALSWTRLWRCMSLRRSLLGHPISPNCHALYAHLRK